MHIFLFEKDFLRYFRNFEFQPALFRLLYGIYWVKSEMAKMSMHLYSTSQKVLFDVEVDLFSAVFIMYTCVDLKSIRIFLLSIFFKGF